MKVFITGANGQLAKSITSYFKPDELYLATKDMLNITDKKAVQKYIKKLKPDVIFHFASMTRGEECAKNPDLAFKINVEGTENVVIASETVGAKFVFISTNEVFNGKAKKPYKETDIPDPITVVGKTKYEAEKIIQQQTKRGFIIRTSWLYSPWSSNFIHTIFNIARKDKKLHLVHDEVGSPTYSDDLSKALKKLVRTKKYGIYHLINTGAISRLDFGKKAFEIHGIRDIRIIPTKLEDYKRLSSPPQFSALQNTKAKKLGIVLPDWEDALRRFLKKHPV